MNDIEVLEKRVITLRRHIKNYEESDCKTNIYQQLVKECQAIENLSNRIKELEEINEAHKKENGELREREKDLQKSVDQIYDDYQDIGKMYFNLTEKIESKIEEINSRIEKYREYAERGIETDVEWVDNVADRETVKVLEKLLKGE